MKHMRQFFARFAADESGQDLIEYALVTALVALAAVSTMGSVASSVTTVFNTVATTLSTAA